MRDFARSGPEPVPGCGLVQPLNKAQDININLWKGLGMLALGLFFLLWLKLRPTAAPTPPLPAAGAGDGTDDGPNRGTSSDSGTG